MEKKKAHALHRLARDEETTVTEHLPTGQLPYLSASSPSPVKRPRKVKPFTMSYTAMKWSLNTSKHDSF